MFSAQSPVIPNSGRTTFWVKTTRYAGGPSGYRPQHTKVLLKNKPHLLGGIHGHLILYFRGALHLLLEGPFGLANGELNTLTFFDVAIAITLDCCTVDKDIFTAFDLKEPVALATIEPFDRTDDSFRHFFTPFENKTVDLRCCLFNRSGQTKTAQMHSVEPLSFHIFQRTFFASYGREYHYCWSLVN